MRRPDDNDGVSHRQPEMNRRGVAVGGVDSPTAWGIEEKQAARLHRDAVAWRRSRVTLAVPATWVSLAMTSRWGTPARAHAVGGIALAWAGGS